jgi:hypothetical protein
MSTKYRDFIGIMQAGSPFFKMNAPHIVIGKPPVRMYPGIDGKAYSDRFSMILDTYEEYEETSPYDVTMTQIHSN